MSITLWTNVNNREEITCDPVWDKDNAPWKLRIYKNKDAYYVNRWVRANKLNMV